MSAGTRSHPPVEPASGARVDSTPGAPAVGAVRWGDFDRTAPISRQFGFERGMCIDRLYIEDFLDGHREWVRGRVLEIAESRYTRQFGGERVSRAEVLFTEPGHRNGTLVGDLTKPETLPTAAFDCVILTQTLQHIYDIQTAVATVHGILRPGGAALVTVPGISHVSRFDMDRWGDFWRFTTLSLARLLGGVFGAAAVCVAGRGNVLAAVGLLHGLAVEEMDRAALARDDADYPVIVTACAVKGGG